MSCTFCRIVAGTEPSQTIPEDTDLTPPWTEVEHPVESLAGLAEEIRAWR
ncbi:hypothetical protein [Nonomuraea sp. 10N515B]